MSLFSTLRLCLLGAIIAIGILFLRHPFGSAASHRLLRHRDHARRLETVSLKDFKGAFITATFGNFDNWLKYAHPQTVSTDYICFTDNPLLKVSENWIIDREPYHISHPSKLDNGKMWNSLINNNHTFNIAKYYKQNFQNIPRLAKYDIIVWLDATLEIEWDNTMEWLYNKMLVDQRASMVLFSHEMRAGKLNVEVFANMMTGSFKYISTEWLGQKQPYQDINKQYTAYINQGYNESFWLDSSVASKAGGPITKDQLGVWMTAFIAFDNKNEQISRFLDIGIFKH